LDLALSVHHFAALQHVLKGEVEMMFDNDDANRSEKDVNGVHYVFSKQDSSFISTKLSKKSPILVSRKKVVYMRPDGRVGFGEWYLEGDHVFEWTAESTSKLNGTWVSSRSRLAVFPCP
jgi:hypothetical protein